MRPVAEGVVRVWGEPSAMLLGHPARSLFAQGRAADAKTRVLLRDATTAGPWTLPDLTRASPLGKPLKAGASHRSLETACGAFHSAHRPYYESFRFTSRRGRATDQLMHKCSCRRCTRVVDVGQLSTSVMTGTSLDGPVTAPFSGSTTVSPGLRLSTSEPCPRR